MNSILVCEDEYDTGRVLCDILREQDYEVYLAEDGEEGLLKYQEMNPDLVLLDIYMPKMNGLNVLQEIMEQNPDQIVIMLTGSADIKQSVQAMKLGAYDYLTKPFDVEEMLLIIKNALKTHLLHKEVVALKERLAGKVGDVVYGESRAIKNVMRLIDLVAATSMSVLITGESGTGKEVFAQQIHRRSVRGKKPFVALDCGAIPENLLESELFGYEKGAFTGADRSHKGKFEDANGGTLLLDEITNLSFDGQAKLLRALEERKIRHVGGKKDIDVDVRIIATTNLELQEVLEAGKFRLDLYHRVNEFQIHLPPLRERKEDIPELAGYFLSTANLELGKKVKGFSPSAMEYIMSNNWPGNVRELKHNLKRAVLLCESDELSLEDISVRNGSSQQNNGLSKLEDLGSNLNEIVRRVESMLINSALEKTRGNKSQAAELLGINRKALYRKMQNLKLE